MKKLSSNDQKKVYLVFITFLFVTSELFSLFGIILEHFLLWVLGVGQPWFGK